MVATQRLPVKNTGTDYRRSLKRDQLKKLNTIDYSFSLYNLIQAVERYFIAELSVKQI
ncbi:MAG: hypothetical protein ACJAU3_001877 [Zhongshania sp.]|jgi:hypothetical protein